MLTPMQSGEVSRVRSPLRVSFVEILRLLAQNGEVKLLPLNSLIAFSPTLALIQNQPSANSIIGSSSETFWPSSTNIRAIVPS